MSASGLNLRFFARSRVPVRFQTEAAECGLACLAMLCSHYGRRKDLSELRREWPVSLKGMSLANLIEIGEQNGLTTRAVRLELDELVKLQTPCILHWGLDHFVVLEKAGSRTLVIVDPAVGRRRVDVREVSSEFSGVALELTPGNDFRKQRTTRSLTLRRFFTDTRGIAGPLIQLLVLSAALQLFVLLAPIYSQIVIDDVVLSGDYDLLTLLGIAFAALAVVTAVTSAFRAWVVVYLGANLGYRWSAGIFRHLVRLPLDYFEKRQVGDIQSRFASLKAIRDLIATQAVEAIVDGLMATTTLVVMYVYNTVLGHVVLGSVLLYTTVRLALFERLRTRSLEEIVKTAGTETLFLESVRGVLAVKNFGRESQRESMYKGRLASAIAASASAQKIVILQGFAGRLIFGLQNVVVIWMGAKAIIAGAFTVGMLVAFLSYRTHFSARAESLIEKLFQFRLARIHLDRLADIVGSEREDLPVTPTSDRPASRRLAGNLTVDAVWFRYGNNEPYVLRGASLDVRAGEQLAIVGPSGCGKSTLFKLMIGLLEPERGRILYDGSSVAEIGLSGLRSQIGVVMQNDRLLGGTLLQNLSFFDAEPDLDWALQCAETAGVAGDIEAMPMGFHTLVGDMGDALSGGQKQRILLARALYARPRFLFLDEATSHLDPEKEVLTVSRIAKLEITRVVVAHRRETVRHSDRVIELSACLSNPPATTTPPS